MTPDRDDQRRARRNLIIIGTIVGMIVLATWVAQIAIWWRG
jgi:hypothetical protein